MSDLKENCGVDRTINKKAELVDLSVFHVIIGGMVCPICSSEFSPKTKNHKYCSVTCRGEALVIRYDKIRKTTKGWQNEERKCATCSKGFKPNQYNQKYCSQACSRRLLSFEYIHSHPELFENNRHSWLKVRVVVFDRDGFTCQYCGRNPREHNTVLHVDHKKPKNKGGGDELDNLITSCQECNLGKNDICLNYWYEKTQTKEKKASKKNP